MAEGDSACSMYYLQDELGRFAAADTIKGFAAAPYTLNEYGYCWNRPLDLVDLNGMIPTAGVTDAMYGTGTPEEKEDPVHAFTDNYSDIKTKKDFVDTYDRTADWYKKYKETKSLKKTLKTAQITEEMAAREGVSLGRYRRVTRANIKNGMKSMEELGNAAKAGSRFGGANVLDIGIDVGVGIYDNYQSGASAAEYVSDATVDVALSTGEAALSIIAASVVAGAVAGSPVPGLGNIAGAIAGLIVGLIIAGVDAYDFDGNGKSLRDDLKDWVYGKISGGNDEKE